MQTCSQVAAPLAPRLLGFGGPDRRVPMSKDLYEIGEIPPVGDVPAQMHAQVVRPERYGEPRDAIRDEVIDVPALGPQRRARDGDGGRRELQQRVGGARRADRRDEDAGPMGRADRLPHRRVGRLGDRLRGRVRRQRPGRRGPRRGPRRPVGPRRSVGRGRERSGSRGELPGLGVRHVLGLDGAVHEGAGASMPPQGRSAHLGGSRRPDPHRRDRLPDAARLAARTP